MLRFHEITRTDDPLLLPWLELYDDAFPPDEKVPIGEHLAVLRGKSRAVAHLLAAVADGEQLVGMARYEIEGNAAYLPYLAVLESARGGGIGAAFYSDIVRRLAEIDPPLQALLFEVEIPELAANPKAMSYAERRIRFYRRLGAKLLHGISYEQEIRGHEPVPMHLMVHPFRPLTPAEALGLADAMFALEATGEPVILE